jgi:hypothetical protein
MSKTIPEKYFLNPTMAHVNQAEIEMKKKRLIVSESLKSVVFDFFAK